MSRCLAILLGVGLSASSTHALANDFVDFRPLTLEELYAKRMRFARGEPIISIGLMEAQKVVAIRSDTRVRMMFDWAGRNRTMFGPAKSRYIFKVERGRPAKVRYWVLVNDHPYTDVLAAENEKKVWRDEGHEAKAFVTGTIVALQGKVLDTRRRLVGIGGFSKKAKADALSQRLFTEKNLRTTIREELETLPSGRISIHDGQGRRLSTAKNVVYFGTTADGQVTVENVEHSRGYKRHGRQTRRFRGHIYIALDKKGKLTVINSVGAERVLAGLVPAEIFATAPLEALKAQAVTARGEVFSKLGHRHFSEPFHLCSEQHCQVYAGAKRERAATNRAVAETRGLLAVRPRADPKAPLKLVDSVYSSTCGGFTEDNEIVWNSPASESLRSKLDGNPNDPALAPFRNGLNESNIRAWLEAYPPTYDARSSFTKPSKYRWKKKISGTKLNAMVRAHKVGFLRDIHILGRGRGGRVTGIRLVGTLGSSDVLRELPVRRLFGNLNSGMFVVDLERYANGNIYSAEFIGGGWGHGVGMCQMGAIGRAQANQTFQQILEHYYNGATVEKLY